MTRFKSNLLIIVLMSLMSTCTGQNKILSIMTKLDPRIQSIKFWADLVIPELLGDDTTKKILSEVKAVSGQISQTRVHLDQRLDVIIKSIPARVRANSRVDDSVKILESEINHVDDLYDIRLARLIEKPNDVGAQNELVDKVLSSQKDVTASINNIYRVIVKDRTLALSEDFLTQVKNQIELVNSDRCDDTVSPHMWLYDIYMNVLITEVRAYILNILAYSIKSKTTHVSYEHTINSLTKELSERLVKYVAEIRPKLAMLPRDIRKCDPKQHVRGKTFIEFEKVQQPFIVNEDQFGSYSTCSQCTSTPPYGDKLILQQNYVNNYPVNRHCNGTVSDCRKFGNVFNSKGEVCILPENSIKRYEWIKSEWNKADYGKTDQCAGEKKKISPHVYEKGGSISWLPSSQAYICPYCLCVCTDKHPYRTLRAINIRETYTNIAENLVTVGIQIVEQKKIIHIRVKQGKLLPGGKIDPNSVSWKPLIDMDYIAKQKVKVILTTSYYEDLVESKDYVHINDYDFNFVLEEVMASKNSIICGARFEPFQKGSLKGIRLQIATAAFDWTSAKINEKCNWQSLDSSIPLKEASTNPSMVQVMKDLDDPTRSENNKPGLKNKVIKFSMSSLVKDAGQSMVPFIDSLPVETVPASPLGGIGFFHKADVDFGGFISPRIYNLDMTDYVSLIHAH